LYEPLGINTKTILTVSLAAVIVSMVAGISMAYADFSGDYDPANWTFTNSPSGDGSVITSAASIELTGSDDDSGAADADYTITIPCTTTISFDWDYATTDLPGFFDDSFYVINGVENPLSDFPASGSVGAGGTLPVAADDIFAFRVSTDDGDFGPGVLTITNFDAGDPCGETDIEIDVDIKPRSDPNSIQTRSMGKVPVAILGSDTFDVADVDVTTLAFGPNAATPAHDLTDPVVYALHLKDVNDDGFTDLVSHYIQKQTGLASGDVEGCITGQTTGGTAIEGCDSVRIL